MKISKSISALGQAVEMDPHAAENIASFALSALTTQDYVALRNILEAHAKANPANVETLYSLAMMDMNENQLQRAKEYTYFMPTINFCKFPAKKNSPNNAGKP